MIHSPMDSIHAAGETWVAPQGAVSRTALSPDENVAGVMGVPGVGGYSNPPTCPALTCPLQLPVAVQLPLCLGPVAAVGPEGSLVLCDHTSAWDRSGGVRCHLSPLSRQPAGTPTDSWPDFLC